MQEIHPRHLIARAPIAALGDCQKSRAAVAALGVGGDQMETMEEILTSKEVAGWIRVSESTLCRWRQRGMGPRVTCMTPTCPRYRRLDVEQWLARAS